MSTDEDREWDERQEYGWGDPRDGGMRRLSAILADQFGPIVEPGDVDSTDEPTPIFDSVVDDAGWNPLEEPQVKPESERS